ncbi:hypothetical protein TNCV_1076581 [Trichonephila clavipes]|uniref:Uncharacterized protein n=1 Tax=Trichonephila clavipes TaxID=2585209 RepID=A0A8X6RYI6_TRICX|nr:hypothetical protein TNCV_1076581 [Trichonephila clavipes]
MDICSPYIAYIEKAANVTSFSFDHESYLQSLSPMARYVLLFPIPLEQESLHQVHLTCPRNGVTHQVLRFIQLSLGNAPAVQKMSRRSKERAGTGKERLFPLHKSHTTQVPLLKSAKVV